MIITDALKSREKLKYGWAGYYARTSQVGRCGAQKGYICLNCNGFNESAVPYCPQCGVKKKGIHPNLAYIANQQLATAVETEWTDDLGWMNEEE